MGNISPVSLTIWINLIKTYLEECGMDTVFRVWDPSTNVEVYLLEEWGEARFEFVKPWVECLKNGVSGRDPCHFDLDNLRWSGKSLLRSITKEVWIRIEKELPINAEPSGPEVFSLIISHVQQVNSSSVRKLISKLYEMTLKDEPGQDVQLLGDKVLEICRSIDGTVMGPKDLVLLCEENFLKSESF